MGRRSTTLLVSLAIASASCGRPRIITDDVPVELDLFPIAVGNWWLYEETDIDNPGETHKEIIAKEEYEGEQTLVMLTTQTNSPVDKRSNWRDDGERIDRVRQERFAEGTTTLLTTRTYAPGFLRLHRQIESASQGLGEGHMRTELGPDGRETEQKWKEYRWTVQATDEEVKVPAGTFRCLRVQRVDLSDDYPGDVKISWYALGVGKVKEEGIEVEKLKEYFVGR